MKSGNVMQRLAPTTADTIEPGGKAPTALPDLSSCSEDINQSALSTDLQNQARVAGAEGVLPSGRIA